MRVYYFGSEDWDDEMAVEMVVAGNQAQAFWQREGYTAVVETRPGAAEMVREIARKAMVGNVVKVQVVTEVALPDALKRVMDPKPDLAVYFESDDLDWDGGCRARLRALRDARIPTYVVRKKRP